MAVLVLGTAAQRDQLVRSLSALISQAREDYDYEDFGDRGGDQRQERQLPPGLPPGPFVPQEECDTAGFERRQREVCEEVPELECYPVNVTKYVTEIVNKCSDVVDAGCHVVQVEKPRKECLPTEKEVCHIDYKIVDQEKFDEVCDTTVRNVCKETYHSPAKAAYQAPPYPVHAPTPYPTPFHAPYPAPAPAPYFGTPPAYPPPYLLARIRRHLPPLPAPPRCKATVAEECHKVAKLVPTKVTWIIG